jgi:transposase
MACRAGRSDWLLQIPALDRSQPVLPIMPGMPERRTHDYVSNGLTTLFAAFDVATGEVITALHRRHRAAEFKKFLIRIDKTVPAHLQIHLIVDNYGTHKTPAIEAWLAKHPRFELHFTPTGSSWINQVERWFGYLAHQMIRRGTQEHPGPGSRHPGLGQRLERRPQAVYLDQNSRRDPRLPRPPLPTDL